MWEKELGSDVETLNSLKGRKICEHSNLACMDPTFSVSVQFVKVTFALTEKSPASLGWTPLGWTPLGWGLV